MTGRGHGRPTVIARFLAAGRSEGTVRSAASDDVIVEQLLAMLTGVQILAVLTPGQTMVARQRQMLEGFLAGLS